MQMDVHKTLYPLYTTKKMAHVAAAVRKMPFVGSIARYITIIYTINTLSADFPSRVGHHVQTRAANVWELTQKSEFSLNGFRRIPSNLHRRILAVT